MKKKILFLIITLVFCMGCATTGQIINAGVEATEQDVKNVEQLREMARNLLETWPMYHGMIVGAFGKRLSDDLPMWAVEAMMMLTEISNQYKVGGLDDYQLGFSLGLRVQIAFSVIQKAIKEYAPDIFDLLPALL